MDYITLYYLFVDLQEFMAYTYIVNLINDFIKSDSYYIIIVNSKNSFS
jgi:hypothetical protein